MDWNREENSGSEGVVMEVVIVKYGEEAGAKSSRAHASPLRLPALIQSVEYRVS